MSPGGPLLTRVRLAEVAAHFGAALRAEGLEVTPDRQGRFAAALALVRPLGLDQLASVGRLTLTGDHSEAERFERVFAMVFRGLVDPAESRGEPRSSQGPPPSRRRGAAPPQGAGALPEAGPTAGTEEGGEERPLGLASGEERLARKDFADCSEAELERLLRLAARLPLAAPRRRSRRRRRYPLGSAVDLRSTLARARRTGADPVRLVRTRRRPRPRRLVMIADVSGSMEPYTRVYLHLFHAAVRSARAEAFVFATRLTRLTPALAARDPDLALRRAAESAQDWSGGTRIGQAIADFNDRYGRPGMARGAVLVVVSDGWEGGDPARLGEEMARLSRMAHRVIWVNPRSASSNFRPETAGMAAALPHLDQLVSGNSLAALDELLSALGRG